MGERSAAAPELDRTRRRGLKRALLVVPLFLALVLVAPAAPAHACTCLMLGSAQKVENADVVVRGTITGLDDPGGHDSAHLVTYEVAVAEVYRGGATATTFAGGSVAKGGAGATATTPPGTPSSGTPLAGSTPPDSSGVVRPLGVGVDGALVAAVLGALWWRLRRPSAAGRDA